MKTIYIDTNFMCRAEYAKGLKKIETDSLGAIPDEAVKYYRFVPSGEAWQGNVCANDFIQCVNSAKVDEAMRKFYAENPSPQAPDGYEYRLCDDMTWKLYEYEE